MKTKRWVTGKEIDEIANEKLKELYSKYLELYNLEDTEESFLKFVKGVL